MTPVVVIHGWAAGSCPKTNPRGEMFGPLAYMWYLGGEWQRPYDPVAFYACDTSGSDIGTHANANTSIETIAHDFAWYVYRTYSSKNVTVSAVGYSMGGLILRSALQEFAAHNATYPPSLLIQDAVTIATPHTGLTVGCASTSYNCAEMATGSAYLKHLALNQNPQGTGGTDWTVIGGSSCDVVSAASAMAMTGAHRWSYAPSTTPVCYTHQSYLWDYSTASDMHVQYSAPGASSYQSATSVHSLAAVQRALDSPYW